MAGLPRGTGSCSSMASGDDRSIDTSHPGLGMTFSRHRLINVSMGSHLSLLREGDDSPVASPYVGASERHPTELSNSLDSISDYGSDVDIFGDDDLVTTKAVTDKARQAALDEAAEAACGDCPRSLAPVFLTRQVAVLHKEVVSVRCKCGKQCQVSIVF